MQVAAGGAHSFVLTLSGAIFGWGRNKFGQLGLNDENGRFSLCSSICFKRSFSKMNECFLRVLEICMPRSSQDK